jgi:hypothetical protein
MEGVSDGLSVTGLGGQTGTQPLSLLTIRSSNAVARQIYV